MSEKKRLMTTAEAAELAGLKSTAIRARLRRKSLNSQKVDDRHLVIHDEAFEHLLKMQKTFPKPNAQNLNARLDELEKKILSELKEIKSLLSEGRRKTK